jgi:hypothetical protein
VLAQLSLTCDLRTGTSADGNRRRLQRKNGDDDTIRAKMLIDSRSSIDTSEQRCRLMAEAQSIQMSKDAD